MYLIVSIAIDTFGVFSALGFAPSANSRVSPPPTNSEGLIDGDFWVCETEFASSIPNPVKIAEHRAFNRDTMEC